MDTLTQYMAAKAVMMQGIIKRVGGYAQEGGRVAAIVTQERPEEIHNWFVDEDNFALAYMLEIRRPTLLMIRGSIYLEPRAAYMRDPDPLREATVDYLLN